VDRLEMISFLGFYEYKHTDVFLIALIDAATDNSTTAREKKLVKNKTRNFHPSG
jgi:hypothetical protein